MNNFTARIPASLDKALEDEAKAERRSKNAQLIRVLEERYGLAGGNGEQEEIEAVA